MVAVCCELFEMLIFPRVKWLSSRLRQNAQSCGVGSLQGAYRVVSSVQNGE